MDAGDCPVATMTPAVAASMPASRKNCHGRSPGSSPDVVNAVVFDPRDALESIEVAELIVQSRSERSLVGTTQGVIDDACRCRDLGIDQLSYDFRTGKVDEMLAIIEHLASAVIPRIT